MRLSSTHLSICRIAPSAPSTTSAGRPRLATSVLRSNSQASTVTTASTITTASAQSADSTAVNPPSTRPVSPTVSDHSQTSAAISATLDASTTGSAPPDGIPAPIVDKEEKLIRGYKNIPSLNAITERMQRAKAEQAQNAANAGAPAAIVVTQPESGNATPTTEEPKSEPEEHPLQHTW